MRLFSKRRTEKKGYDADMLVPVIKSSICTGEQVAGFMNKNTGAIEELMLITGAQDILKFKEEYGITGEIKKIY